MTRGKMPSIRDVDGAELPWSINRIARMSGLSEGTVKRFRDTPELCTHGTRVQLCRGLYRLRHDFDERPIAGLEEYCREFGNVNRLQKAERLGRLMRGLGKQEVDEVYNRMFGR